MANSPEMEYTSFSLIRELVSLYFQVKSFWALAMQQTFSPHSPNALQDRGCKKAKRGKRRRREQKSGAIISTLGCLPPFPSLLPTIGIPFCQSGILLPEVYGICCDGGGSELPECVNMAEWMGKRRGELFVSPYSREEEGSCLPPSLLCLRGSNACPKIARVVVVALRTQVLLKSTFNKYHDCSPISLLGRVFRGPWNTICSCFAFFFSLPEIASRRSV